MDILKNKIGYVRRIAATPFVLSLIIPLVLLDIWMEVYHRVCFPLCKIPYVKRSNYVKIDRHKLEYLNIYRKVFCVYCGYGNGVINYWREIAARTEKSWCGIKHKKTSNFKEPQHHSEYNFAEYGNKKDFEDKYIKK